ncbi:hypothetical protein BaRGS_00024382 [Batillaria attramentaria]|uniref:Uncharacterized protein n=1 Tax=Batillaria attramentaria TaxID=370345 RepID=A0ABD0KBB5_9CAEN
MAKLIRQPDKATIRTDTDRTERKDTSKQLNRRWRGSRNPALTNHIVLCKVNIRQDNLDDHVHELPEEAPAGRKETDRSKEPMFKR